MNKESFNSFNKQLSWNTKFYVLLAFVMVLLGFLSEGNELGLFAGSIIALLVVLLVDYYQIVSKKYPELWSKVKLVIIGIIMLITLIGFVPKM